MLLRIIDRSDTEESAEAIEIVLERNEGKPLSFLVPEFSASVSKNLSNDKQWYFRDYLRQYSDASDDRNVPARLIAAGEQLGDSLLGEDHQLIQIKEIIEDEGYENVRVQIESSNSIFFNESWENLILPFSKYILSTVSNGFSRRLLTEETNVAEKNYHLDKENPLTILYAVPTGAEDRTQNSISFAYKLLFELMAFDGAFSVEILPFNDLKQLSDRLGDNANPVHILHLDSTVNDTENEAIPPLSSTEKIITPSDIAKVLKQHPVGLVVFNDNERNNDEANTQAAQQFLCAGVTAVIAVGTTVDPLIADHCLTALYKEIASGRTLSHAVVETRKKLQSQLESDFYTLEAVPFQAWPLLHLYDNASVRFFSKPQAETELVETTLYSSLRDRLHGIATEFIPPYFEAVDDGVLPDIIHHWDEQQFISILGKSGCGKTLACHSLGSYLLTQNSIDQVFYFDFLNHHYSSEDIFGMIKPVLASMGNNNTSPSADQTPIEEDLLKDAECLFIFDNFFTTKVAPSSDQGEQISDLEELLAHLKKLGQRVIITADEADTKLGQLSQKFHTINTKPLPSLSQQYLAARTLKRSKDLPQNDNNLLRLVNSVLPYLEGQPFLTEKMATALIDCDIPEREVQSLAKHMAESKDPASAFYQWQCDLLPVGYIRWLLLFHSAPMTLLEMITMVYNHAKQFPPTDALSKLIDCNEPFSEVSAQLQRSGFLIQHPYGRVIDPRCQLFLHNKLVHDEVLGNQHHQKGAKLLFSRMVCKALCGLIPHLLQQPNPFITRHILSMRGELAQHLEAIWYSEKKEGLLETLSQIEKLFQQHNLHQELPSWSLNLLDQMQTAVTIDEDDEQGSATLLFIASRASKATTASKSERLKQLKSVWFQWATHLNSSQIKEHSALFFHCLEFLTPYCEMTEDRKSLITLSETAYTLYRENNVWPLAIRHLHTLIECLEHVSDIEAANRYENVLLNEVPFDQMPPGSKANALMQLIASHISLDKHARAQTCLDILKLEPDAQHYHFAIEIFQGDIWFSRGKHIESTQHFSRLWKENIEEGQPSNVEILKQRLMRAATKLGQSRFDQLFKNFAGEECLHPLSMNSQEQLASSLVMP